MKKKIEYICINCWNSFQTDEINPSLIKCPHCGSTQDMSDQHFEFNINDYLGVVGEQDDSLAKNPNTSLQNTIELSEISSTEVSGTEVSENDQKPEKSHSSAEPDDGVIEIDLEELDEMEEELKSSNESGAGEGEVVEGEGESEEEEKDKKVIWYLKSANNYIYEFVNYDTLIKWAVGMGQNIDDLQISMDGVTWKAFKPFYNKYIELSGNKDIVEIKGETLYNFEDESEKKEETDTKSDGNNKSEESSSISDAELLKELEQEQKNYETGLSVEAQATAATSNGALGAQSEVNIGASPVDGVKKAAEALGLAGEKPLSSEDKKIKKTGVKVKDTSQFSFKITPTVVEVPFWKYFLIFILGFITGGGAVFALYYFDILQKFIPK